ncbi:4-coumarate-CoA ligase [Neurospora intermedia]|uniref:4-coumarate-CoA ligase n=1 Tax=Neurospora intermedia TaxID=5142 RepID=A0ABR3CXV5_NEUIN
MATIVEKTSSGIIYKASQQRDFPQLDLLSLLFDSSACGAKEDTVVHADAADPSKAVSKAQLRHLVKRLAYTLRQRYSIGQDGPEKDVVLCISSGHFLLPCLFYSTIAAGAIFSASSPASTATELAGQIKQIGAKLIMCNEDTKEVAAAAAKLANIPGSQVLVLGSQSHLELTNLEQSTPIPISTETLGWQRMTDTKALENSIICILFSSGTTGLPKMCRLSHTNMVSQACLVLDPAREYEKARGRDMSADYRTIAHLPAAHIAGVQGYFVNSFYVGGTLYWMPRFNLVKFLEYSKKYQITNLVSVPPIYLAIAKSPLVTDQFDSLEWAVAGAAPIGKELQLAARKKLGKGKAHLTQTWGLSETTGAMTTMPRGIDDETGSVSMLVMNGRARIVDDDGKDVEPGQAGELWVKGPNVTKGYYMNDAANKEAFVDGWFCTGDIGLFKDGKFYIVDRKKELIKYKGLQVAPAELEALLVSHAKIADAAVIGVDGEATEVPRAYVVAGDATLKAEEIVDWVASKVANHKKLRGGVVFIDAIPKSPSGKILRKELRQLAKRIDKGSKL